MRALTVKKLTESAFVVVSHRITAVLVFVKICNVDAEERVWDPGGQCWIGKIDIDEKSGDQTENWVPAPGTAASVGIQRPDDTILVLVPVNYVLLHDLTEG
jgi:hypothetical protein